MAKLQQSGEQVAGMLFWLARKHLDEQISQPGIKVPVPIPAAPIARNKYKHL